MLCSVYTFLFHLYKDLIRWLRAEPHAILHSITLEILEFSGCLEEVAMNSSNIATHVPKVVDP